MFTTIFRKSRYGYEIKQILRRVSIMEFVNLNDMLAMYRYIKDLESTAKKQALQDADEECALRMMDKRKLHNRSIGIYRKANPVPMKIVYRR